MQCIKIRFAPPADFSRPVSWCVAIEADRLDKLETGWLIPLTAHIFEGINCEQGTSNPSHWSFALRACARRHGGANWQRSRAHSMAVSYHHLFWEDFNIDIISGPNAGKLLVGKRNLIVVRPLIFLNCTYRDKFVCCRTRLMIPAKPFRWSCFPVQLFQ